MAIVNDKPSLPVEWFEMEELNGNCGKRSGRPPLLIPSVYATWAAAAAAAQYGDDIVIDHTYTGTTVTDQFIPEKTFGPTTPRMPPTQKRPITMSRAITSAH